MASADRSLTRRIPLPGADPRPTLRPLSTFATDPTNRWRSNGFARAVHTPDGPGVLCLSWSVASGEATAEAWGSGASWLIDAAPNWLGAHDPVEEFDPSAHPHLDTLWRRARRPRLGRSGVVWQELAFAVLGQRVTTQDAARQWRRVVRSFGTPAPGPLGLTMPPSPEALAATSYVTLHRLGVERRRADALTLAARYAGRLEEAASMPADAAIARLTAVSGIGIWTATTALTASHGDPDTVVIGDYGLPSLVSFAFTGSTVRADDATMLDLLAPFAGHRQRVVRLLYGAGVGPLRRAPRARNPRIEHL